MCPTPGAAVMVSLLRKAARMSLVAMDFVLQVTVEELVLGRLDGARLLSFELSRGTKVCAGFVQRDVHLCAISFCMPYCYMAHLHSSRSYLPARANRRDRSVISIRVA